MSSPPSQPTYDFLVIAPTPIILYCDNKVAMHIVRNPVFHEIRTKHFKMDCHLVRHYFSSGFILPQFIPSSDQAAEMFTKALASQHLVRLSSKLRVSNILHTMSLGTKPLLPKE